MNDVSLYDEPQLQFAAGGILEHPRDGLTLFGPADSAGAGNGRSPGYGIVGTINGITGFRDFAGAVGLPILTEKHLEDILWPHFPGFEEAFHAKLPVEPVWAGELDTLTLKTASTERDDHKRVFNVASLFLEKIQRAKMSGRIFDFFVVVVPDFVFATCRPLARFYGGHGKRVGKREQRLRAQILDFFESYEPEQYKWSLDFRCQIKARAMALGVPVQIIRESTLLRPSAERRSGGRQLTPFSDRAWNLSTALYCKSGGVPWKLSNASPEAVHIGVSFKETETVNSVLSTAQVFLNDGHGQVLAGDQGPWSTEKKGVYHLNKQSAGRLLSLALSALKARSPGKVAEVYVHCRSKITAEELEGYQEACPPEVKLTIVRVVPERLGLRLCRAGAQPVMRGTFWQVAPQRGFLWTSGFKPRLRGYDGVGIPQPLYIEIQYGNPEISRVAKSIFALTKLNYNSCNLGENQPVTTRFGPLIGEILTSNQTIHHYQHDFKYYI